MRAAQVSTGPLPLVAQLGQLERVVLGQVAASDPWKQQYEAAKAADKAAAAAGAAADPSRAASPSSVLRQVLGEGGARGVDADVAPGGGDEVRRVLVLFVLWGLLWCE